MKTQKKISQALRTIILTWVLLSPICMFAQPLCNWPEFDGNNDYVVLGNPTLKPTSALRVDLWAYSENLTTYDESYPSQIALFTRSSNADTNWVFLTNASSVDATNEEANFDGIMEFSQFIIGRWILFLDIPQNVTIETNGNEIKIILDCIFGENCC